MSQRIPLPVLLGASVVLTGTACSARAQPTAASAAHSSTTAGPVIPHPAERVANPRACMVRFPATWTPIENPLAKRLKQGGIASTHDQGWAKAMTRDHNVFAVANDSAATSPTRLWTTGTADCAESRPALTAQAQRAEIRRDLEGQGAEGIVLSDTTVAGYPAVRGTYTLRSSAATLTGIRTCVTTGNGLRFQVDLRTDRAFYLPDFQKINATMRFA